jgi:lysophospholipase L1-like esterase
MLTSLKFTALPFVVSFSLLTGPACVLSGDTAGADTRSNAAAIPVDRLGEAWWAERHAAVLADGKRHSDAQLLMIGDSITNNYVKATLPDENFQPTWKQFYEPRIALNLGFSGDTTANLLWRLDHGEIDGLRPKVAVVLIGTNNTGVAKQTAEQTEVGIDAVVVDLERRLPLTKILLLGVLPSGISSEKTVADEAVNCYLARVYGENPRVTYLDVGSIFFDYASGEGKLKSAIFYDPRLSWHPGPLHPDTVGQRMMAEAIEPTLARLMGDQPQVPLESMTNINTALIPTERLELDSYDWYARHHAELELQKTLRPKVVMIGDSITNFWGGPPYSNRVNGPVAWQHLFGDTPVLNMGFGWDRIQNVLWRLRQGEFDGLTPDWIVLNIGTNNLTGTVNARASSPAEIVAGIDAIRRELLKRSPKSHLVVMAIFPRGAKARDPLRAPILEVNRLLMQRFGADASVTMLDIGSRFLQPDGSLPAAMMPDGVHPSEAGYAIWADALQGVFGSP